MSSTKWVALTILPNFAVRWQLGPPAASLPDPEDFYLRREIIKGLSKLLSSAQEMTVDIADVVCDMQELASQIETDACEGRQYEGYGGADGGHAGTGSGENGAVRKWYYGNRYGTYGSEQAHCRMAEWRSGYSCRPSGSRKNNGIAFLCQKWLQGWGSTHYFSV